MAAATLPVRAPAPLLRVDGATGALRERTFTLEVVAGPDAGRSLAIDSVHVVGGGAEADLRLSDPTVSRQHLELEARSDGVRVRDLSSTNGTYLFGARITEVLVEKDLQLTIGKTPVKISVRERDASLPSSAPTFGRLAGRSAPMQRLFALLSRIAPTDSSVLLHGETGTGKEVIAEAIHQASARAHRPLVVVDCSALAGGVIESELFGHVKGAFTGAASSRAGAFVEADGGTLFLDEIGELPLDQQPKLLRVLESGMVKAVGGDRPSRVDVRVISATNRDLGAEVEAGRFRRDLYFRLNVVPIHVPPLRDRADDIPALVHVFLNQLGRSDFELSPELRDKLTAYRWPGNVRELRNVIEAAVSGAAPELSASTAVSSRPHDELGDLPFKEAKDRLIEGFTREYIERLLEKHGGNISQVARAAGIARNHVYNLVAKYGLKGS